MPPGSTPSAPVAQTARPALLLMAGAMFSFAVLDGLRKALTTAVPAGVIVASRYAMFLVVVGWWVHRDGVVVLRSGHRTLQVVRALVMAAEATVFVYALRYASLADANAVFALAPVAGVLLAVLLLREPADRATWAALATSLAGILLMVRPSAHSRELGLLLALASALLYALYGILTRKVSDRDDARTSFGYMTVAGTLAVAIVTGVQAPHWHHPTARDAILLALAAIAAGLGQYLLIKAYTLAPAVILQPYTYLLFAWSVPISIVFFGVGPSPSALAGAVLVIAAGSWLFLRSGVRT